MKVQTRLYLLNSVVFACVFAAISMFIYIQYARHSEKNISANLKKIAHITALFYLEEDELNNEEYVKVKNQFNEFVTNSFYQIYDSLNNVSYGSQNYPTDIALLNKIRKEKSLTFKESSFICYGIYYEDNQGNFVIIAREDGDDLHNQKSLLLWILIIAFLLGLAVIAFLSRWMAYLAYKPFRLVIKQVNNISTNNLSVKIKSPNTSDELQDLIITFNNLLSKISETVVIQKNFVKYVSHEFKTPLASLLGHLEVFSLKDRRPEEYKQLSETLIQQVNALEETLNVLITVSDLDENTDTPSDVRVDELLWDIMGRISQYRINQKATINIDIPSNETAILSVVQNKAQLYMVFYNLIENAIKYSKGNPVEVTITKTSDNRLKVSILDHGIGIPSEELNNISKPFFRAGNAQQQRGSGIGLSIALRILEKNEINYHIDSELNIGTTVTVIF